MVQSLCVMVLLEGCSPRQAFAQFLLARKVSDLVGQFLACGVGTPLLFCRLQLSPHSWSRVSIGPSRVKSATWSRLCFTLSFT